jgi:hypothetical protein
MAVWCVALGGGSGTYHFHQAHAGCFLPVGVNGLLQAVQEELLQPGAAEQDPSSGVPLPSAARHSSQLPDDVAHRICSAHYAGTRHSSGRGIQPH